MTKHVCPRSKGDNVAGHGLDEAPSFYDDLLLDAVGDALECYRLSGRRKSREAENCATEAGEHLENAAQAGVAQW